MGLPKWRLDLGCTPLLLLHVEAFLRAGLRVIVVTGAEGGAVRAVLGDRAECRHNEDWSTSEMAASLEIGLRSVGCAIVTPVDVPPVASATLAALLAVRGNAVPSFEGVDGHPVRVEGFAGGRLDEHLRTARRIPVEDPDCVSDFDEPEAWAAFAAGWSSRRAPGAPR